MAPNYDKQYLLKITGKMEPIEQRFTDVLQQKRLQTLQSVDDMVDKVWLNFNIFKKWVVYWNHHVNMSVCQNFIAFILIPDELIIEVTFYKFVIWQTGLVSNWSSRQQ